MLSAEIIAQIQDVFGRNAQAARVVPTSGGDINQAFVLELQGAQVKKVFVKQNTIEHTSMFEACSAKLGKALALQHQITSNVSGEIDGFGWQYDNFIGLTPQSNKAHQSWSEFYANERITRQLHIAKGNGLANELVAKTECVILNIEKYYSGYAPMPSLLHGDLWSGNAAQASASSCGAITPILFDPAPYFGDREADLAMTLLFGGFNQNFYDAYNEVWPLNGGFQSRVSLLNLYHALNHFNLFGDGYSGLVSEFCHRAFSIV